MISVGVLLLMPVVFVEMLCCDLLRHLGGHAAYDAALLLLTAAYSLCVAREREKKLYNELRRRDQDAGARRGG